MGISLQLPEGSPGRTILRVLLLLLAEAALITLVKDAPYFVVIATALCPIAALALLESENWIKHPLLPAFRKIAIVAVSIVYFGFVIFAIVHAAQRERANRELEDIYSRMSIFAKTEADLINREKKDGDYFKDVAQYRTDYETWEKQTANWLEENLSSTAREKFLDYSGFQYHCWGLPDECRDKQVSWTFERFLNARRNMEVIMRSRGANF
jgi:hypothetical protein